ncbi:MAG: hypothetical protein WA918_03435 [Erythrobacter sp.]
MRSRPTGPMFGNMLLVWIALAILTIGGAFIFFYGSLRSDDFSASAAQPAGASSQLPEPGAIVSGETNSALQQLGIGDEAESLSPEARAAIARAHQAALSANRGSAAEAEPTEEISPAVESEDTPL